MKVLVAYDWPGNVRELENCIEGCCAMNSGPAIHTTDLPSSITDAGARLSERSSETKIMRIADLEKQAIVGAIEKLNGDKLMAVDVTTDPSSAQESRGCYSRAATRRIL